MSVKINEIKNLTTGKVISDAAENGKFDVQESFSETIIASDVDAEKWKGFSDATNNIQVSWTGDGDKVIARGVGGRFEIKEKKVTIKGLVNASKYGVGINGELLIGPEDKKEVAVLRVRVGNLVTKQNPSGDWIIDFSDKTDSEEGSGINLQQLIDWIKEKTKDDVQPDIPPIKEEGDEEAKEPKDFNILFKNFYFNITQRTFDFWVVSKGDESITFGDFTIRKVGFRVTNVATAAAPPALEEKPEKPALDEGSAEEEEKEKEKAEGEE